MELNKATLKYHFPLPFIDQVLDTLAGKTHFSFLDGFSRYNQIRIAPEDQEKCLCIQSITIWSMKHTRHISMGGPWYDCIEVYMDDFIVMGDTFEEYLLNVEKVLQRFIETNLSLSNAFFYDYD